MFNLTSTDGRPIWINPAAVVAVTPSDMEGGMCLVYTTAHNDRGPHYFTVLGEYEQIRDAIAAQMIPSRG